MFDHQTSTPNSVLRFLADLYSSKSTANLLYSNDAKVLIDINVRQLTDLSAGDKVWFALPSPIASFMTPGPGSLLMTTSSVSLFMSPTPILFFMTPLPFHFYFIFYDPLSCFNFISFFMTLSPVSHLFHFLWPPLPFHFYFIFHDPPLPFYFAWHPLSFHFSWPPLWFHYSRTPSPVSLFFTPSPVSLFITLFKLLFFLGPPPTPYFYCVSGLSFPFPLPLRANKKM